MKKYSSIIAAALMATGVASGFAQGTVVFNNGTGLVLQETSTGFVPVPKGGGQVQLFWATAGTPYTPWTGALTPAAWYAANAGWILGPAIGFTTPSAGKFNGGVLTLSPVSPGGTIDYVVAAWTGNAPTMDAALASDGMVAVSSLFTSATGNPTTIPPDVPVPLADSFGGLAIAYIPEPSSFALAVLGAASLLVFRRRE
jgi:hypothetical protein